MDVEPITHEPRQPQDPSHATHRRWWKIGVGAAATVVVAVIVVRAPRSMEKKAEERTHAELEGEWGALQGCLLGAPLPAEQSAAARFRAVQLTVLGTPREARATPHEGPWPARCEGYAVRVAKVARDRRDPASRALATSADALAHDLHDDAAGTADLGKLVTLVWRDADAASLKQKPTMAGDVPPPSVPLLHATALRGVEFRGDFSLSSIKTDPAPTENLRFLIDDQHITGGRVVCSVSGTPATTSCLGLGGQASQMAGLTLLGTTAPEAHPWVFAGDRGELGIFRPSGAIAMTGYHVAGAAAEPDGAAWLLVQRTGAGPNDLYIVHAPMAGDVPPPTRVTGLERISSVDDLELTWGWLVLRAAQGTRLPHHLVAHQLLGNGTFGEPVDIGEADGVERPKIGEPRFTTCRSGDNLVVRLHGGQGDLVTFHTGVAWTTPKALPMTSGALTCEKNEAVVTALTTPSPSSPDSLPVIAQARCNAAGCATARVSVHELFAGTDVAPVDADAVAVAEVGGKTLLVWSAGAAGGLRMRLATLEGLKGTEDVVLYDTAENGGNLAVQGLRLLAAPDSAVLFIKTADGARLIGIDRDGKATAVHTANQEG